MGNSLGGTKSVKVMKIDGETFKLKPPVTVSSVLENYPDHVLLESEAVKHYGVRAKPMGGKVELKPGRLYFLVVLPKSPEVKSARRVRSGIQMTAKDRLEGLLLARRSSSDLSILTRQGIEFEETEEVNGGGDGMRVKMRLPKAEVEKLMAESNSEEEMREKIVSLCMSRSCSTSSSISMAENEELRRRRGSEIEAVKPAIKKRVGFMPIQERDIHLAVAS